ncbi:hypothetical protein [Streptosporangium roseum]|uniref:hypothetical protein n=1 Tax=Streptosporangium roseum TaxID=2001 RepID=UPI0033241418
MAGSLVAYLASSLHLAAPAEPATYGLGVRWTDPLLIACAIVPAVLFALARRDAGGRARIGCLGWLLRLGTLWAGANVMAYPAGVLMYLGTAELSRHPGAWLVTAASPFAALAIAWWFRPVFPPLRVPYLLLRAGLLLTGCVAAVLVAYRGGLPVTTVAGAGAGASLAAALATVTTWWMMDRLPPLRQLVWAVVPLGACIAVGAATEADGMLVLTGRTAGSGAVLWAAFLLAVLQVSAGFLVCLAVWRLVDQLRTGTLSRASDRSGGLWPPKPGQVWYAEVPFRENHGESKERPVLVLRAYGDHADVLKITSQDKTRLDSHIHLPLEKWHRVLDKESWLELRVTPLAYGNFYNLRGLCRYGVWRDARKRSLRARERPGTGARTR